MDGKNGTSQQMNRSSQSASTANKQNDIPDAQITKVVKIHLVGGEEENITDKIKIAEKKKEKPSDAEDSASCKQKSENNIKLGAKKPKIKLNIGNQSLPTPLSHISLKTIMDIETEFVYTDEEDIPFEFADPVEPTSTQGGSSGWEEGNSLSTADDFALPQVDRELQRTLQAASTYYRQNNHAAAVEQLSAAQELCSKGVAIEHPFKTYPEDISSIASFIETKLVICYLKLKKPDEALNHSHRSIILNPAYFRNHLRQAAAFRSLERFSEAARSAMIADHIYWLTGGTEQHTSKLIKQYWQAMHEEAMVREVSFSVMYTPIVTKDKADRTQLLKDMFAKRHPGYVEHIYTEPHGFHILPQTTEAPPLPSKQYSLTLGFRNKYTGKILERWSNKKLPIFSERKAPFCPPTEEETKAYWENTGGKIMPIMDFVRSTKLIDAHCACSRGMEKLHHASLLGRMQRVEEQSQVINQALAELATLPYLQDIGKKDARLIGLIEDYLYEAEDNYLKNKRLRRDKMGKMNMNKTCRVTLALLNVKTLPHQP
ncbi:spermatogenesis-associated protein 16 isoform X2 [Heliangelus exortis]|uniref:spermatogenesis-associated protein 16 isoform X2 n=1 Tax=Heliangelus exortis TaxID=472823 RepID=UPI003A936ABF